MARSVANRLIEDLGNARRDTAGPAAGPATESANARVELVGPFSQANVAASQSGVAMVAGSNTQTGIVAHSPGKIIGITYNFNAAITAGGATAAQFQATVAPAATLTAAAQGDALAVASQASPRQAGTLDESAEVPFAKGDVLGINLSTSGTLAPTTVELDAYLVVRWAPSPT